MSLKLISQIFFVVSVIFVFGCATAPISMNLNENNREGNKRIIYRDLTKSIIETEPLVETEKKPQPQKQVQQDIKKSKNQYIALICYIVFFLSLGVAGPVVI